MIGFVLAMGMGMVLGLLGGGGSILTVPILVYLFKVPAALATGYSLFVVGITSAIAAFRYRRQLNWRVGALFAIPSTIGVILSRRYVLQPMPDQLSLGTIVGGNFNARSHRNIIADYFDKITHWVFRRYSTIHCNGWVVFDGIYNGHYYWKCYWCPA
tara:strand:+ start:286 stop:756 length:471 start_codon:yes stop_codon:yes gene_type:complete